MPFNSVDQKLRHELIKYNSAYNEAEKALKYFEVNTDEGLLFPTVNELRCAGQHVARAFVAENVELALKCMDEACCHARRGVYEAYDAHINYYLSVCSQFKKDYRQIAISPIIKTYVKDCKELDEIIKAIALEDREKKEDYSEIKQMQFEKVKRISERWEPARDELNKVAEDKASLAKTNVKMFWIAAGSLVVAVMMAGLYIHERYFQ